MSLFMQITGLGDALKSGAVPPGLGGTGGLGGLGVFGALFATIAIIVILVFIILYVFLALAFKKIGTKTGLQNPNVSWINPVISIFEISKMHWWPWPMLFIGIMLSQLLILASPIFGGIIYSLFLIAFLVMTIIWHWKTFEAVGRPGWWILIPIVIDIIAVLMLVTSPIAGIALGIIGFILFIVGFITYLILVGLAAWGSPRNSSPTPKIRKI